MQHYSLLKSVDRAVEKLACVYCGRTATHCNTLQHTATLQSPQECGSICGEAGVCVLWAHCNILQPTATHCNALQHYSLLKSVDRSVEKLARVYRGQVWMLVDIVRDCIVVDDVATVRRLLALLVADQVQLPAAHCNTHT